MIILMVNPSDFGEIMRRGTMERFLDDGSVIYTKGPWFEFIFGISHVSRMIIQNFLHYDELLMKSKERKTREDKSKQNLIDIIKSFYLLVNMHQAKCIIAFHSFISDCQKNDDLKEVMYKTHENGISVIDLMTVFTNKECDEYYWKTDGHWNNIGNFLISNETRKQINIE
ncbi:MAG: hypothetical protein M9958_00630 [Chitinophagales bacterium]|nr:hypothetical protein [Chitinophagales bacterium]